MLNQNIISNKFDLNWSTTFSYTGVGFSTCAFAFKSGFFCVNDSFKKQYCSHLDFPTQVRVCTVRICMVPISLNTKILQSYLILCHNKLESLSFLP